MSTGVWGPAPVAFSYQWQRDSKAIASATGPTYRLVVADIGAEISVVLTGSKAGYEDWPRTSGFTEKVAEAQFVVQQASVVTGVPVTGQYLDLAEPAVVPTPDELSIQWMRGSDPIPGATRSRYLLTDADLGLRISVEIRVAGLGYSTAVSTSAPTAKISAPRAFTTAPKPTISGSAQVGATLTAKPGTWVPAASTTTYTWKVGGVPVAGATDAAFVPRSTDRKKSVTVTVTSATPGYVTKSTVSVATKAVAYGTISAATPTIGGTAKVGQKLSAVTGTWRPAGVTFRYQWMRAAKAIKGATAADYTTTATDYNKSLTVRVSGSKSGFTSVAKTSKAIKVAAGVLTATPVPVVTGDVRVGSVVTVSPGTWAPGSVAKTYQWLANGVAIKGATATKLTVPSAALGRTLTVRVTGKKAGYTTVSSTSLGTTVVAGTFATAPLPAVSGVPAVGITLTAKPGGWVPLSSTTFSYQWFSTTDGAQPVAIAKATSSRFTPGTTMVDARLSVSVTAKRAGFVSQSTTSAPSAAVLAKLLSPTPTVTGTAQVSKRLKVSVGAWTPGATVSVQWLRSKSGTVRSIVGATATSYILTAADRGWKITARVTGRLAGFGVAQVTSKATAKVS